MSNQPSADVLPGNPQAWESVRRVREPVAWALLVIAAVMVLLSAGQLFNVAGLGPPICGGPPSASGCFVARAAAVLPQFADWTVIAPPVLSVILVAFTGGPTQHARQVLRATAAVQAGTLVFGVVSLVAVAAGTTYQAGISYVFDAVGLAITVTALIFTAAVIASRAVRRLAPRH